MDDFYEYPSEAHSGLISSLLSLVYELPKAIPLTLVLASFIILVARLLRAPSLTKISGVDGNNAVPVFPTWKPFIGHAYEFFSEPARFISRAREQLPNGICSIQLGGCKHNIVLDPSLIAGIPQQNESVLDSRSQVWRTLIKFFGVPNNEKSKYENAWKELETCDELLIEPPYLDETMKATTNRLQENISHMVSFTNSEIDQQPWERAANASCSSEGETEVNLLILLKDMMGHTILPNFFGAAFLDKYPTILNDVYEMDAGMKYFMAGLPPWTPWPAVNKAYQARQRVWKAVDDLQTVLDASVDGKSCDTAWGDLEDISPLILKRHEVYRKHNIPPKSRSDASILFLLTIPPSLIAQWLFLHILSNDTLQSRIRAEIAPFAQVAKPFSIGKFSEAPKLTLDHVGLVENCPLLRSTYYETLRLYDQSWSMKEVQKDITITSSNHNNKSLRDSTFHIPAGEHIAIPHFLARLDPTVFPKPSQFDPERFLTSTPDFRSISMNPFTERHCLTFVAGVLAFWDIEPVSPRGWEMPAQSSRFGVSLPACDTRVRIRRRKFEWDGV